MSRMKFYQLARVRVSDDDQKALEMLLTRKDDKGAIVEEPPEFPLTRATVTFNGNQATVSVPRRGQAARRICRLIEAKLSEPRGKGDPTVITGQCRELLALKFAPEDASMTLVIEEYAQCATC